MGSVPPLLSFLLMVVSGWVYRHQLIVIEFLQTENRLLKERLRGKRILFTDAERALLARKAKAVGRKALLKLDTLVSPDTLMRWHRRLIAQKWDFSRRRGRSVHLFGKNLFDGTNPDKLPEFMYRRLVAEKWDFSKRRGPGRPGHHA